MNDLPQTYTQLLQDLKKGSLNIKPLMIYPRENLEKMNQTSKIGEFAPGAILVGSDSGGEAIVLDMRENSSTKGGFYFMPFIPSDWKDAKYAGNTLEEIKAKYDELWGN